MNYAVIKSGGKQYKVSEGNIIEVDKIKADKGKMSFDKVLLLVSEGSVKIGNPTISGEKINAEIIEEFKGKKVRVSKFKSKVRYRRVTGFRASLSKVKIGKIGKSSPEKEKATKKAK